MKILEDSITVDILHRIQADIPFHGVGYICNYCTVSSMVSPYSISGKCEITRIRCYWRYVYIKPRAAGKRIMYKIIESTVHNGHLLNRIHHVFW